VWQPCELLYTCYLLLTLRDCEFVQLNHLVYSPDLAPSDYFLIGNLKYRLHGTWFTDDESLTITVEASFESQNRKFCFQIAPRSI